MGGNGDWGLTDLGRIDNANRIVYDKLSTWIMTAFNGEFIKWANMRPKEQDGMAYNPNEDDDDENHDKLARRWEEGRGRKMLRSEMERLGMSGPKVDL